eukprot:TRINITY_DN51315_c0_g1_i1.p1 TRINITY_DN51315_c0_g1~~TRINITY_DN51315_c0_g1_i1.p1  ORF type:complete len:373 (-),score=62.37 TRINITY_DN51315_c0_g1_i1:356-1474(-)
MADQTLTVYIFVTLWYLTSFGTLLLNKYLLGTVHIMPNTLALVQMVSTAIYGAVKTVRWRDFLFLKSLLAPASNAVEKDVEDGCSNGGANGGTEKVSDDRRFFKRRLAQLSFVGGMRFATVILGLVSLKYVAASFTETIKASAPFFTVVIAFFMLGERTTFDVVLSLVPVASGLVMVSYSELSFNMIGFSAAISTNIIECVQNVFSKRLLSGEFTASQLQFYTSMTALVLQGPMFLLEFMSGGGSAGAPTLVRAGNLTITAAGGGSEANATAVLLEATAEGAVGASFDSRILFLLWIDGVLYHAQSVVAYVVMSYLSPVTVSVVNTLKRAMAIWISVLVFGNTVTPMAGIGSAICLAGALWYNIARQNTVKK